MIKKETPARLANQIEPLNNDILLSFELFEAAIELNGRTGIDVVESARKYLEDVIINLGILSDELVLQRSALEKDGEPERMMLMSVVYGIDDDMRRALAQLDSANKSLDRITSGLANHRSMTNSHRAFMKELVKLCNDVSKHLIKIMEDRAVNHWKTVREQL